MRLLLIIEIYLLFCSYGQAQDSEGYIRLRGAKDVIERTFKADIKSSDVLLINYAIMSQLGGQRFRDAFPLPFDTLVTYDTMLESFSKANNPSFSIEKPSRLELKPEKGCPAPAKKRKFPCTVHSQIQEYLSGLDTDSTEIMLVPIFYIDRQAYDVPAEGYVAYTLADSFHDLYYTWYTLMVNIFRGDELIYYDQHTYFTKEVLPEDQTPEIYIPQSAMDSLVTLTMQGYINGVK